MPLDKEHECIYQVNADKGIKCECSECKNCRHYKNVKKYKVVWMDNEGNERTKTGFKTSEEAHYWISKHYFDEFEFPTVLVE